MSRLCYDMVNGLDGKRSDERTFLPPRCFFSCSTSLFASILSALKLPGYVISIPLWRLNGGGHLAKHNVFVAYLLRAARRYRVTYVFYDCCSLLAIHSTAGVDPSPSSYLPVDSATFLTTMHVLRRHHQRQLRLYGVNARVYQPARTFWRALAWLTALALF